MTFPDSLSVTIPTLPPALPAMTAGGRCPVWIMQVPVLSTLHVPRAAFERLPEIGGQYMGDPANGCGALLLIEDWENTGIMDPELDEALTALVEYVAARGFHYLRFDPDGEVCADLPVFDW